MTDPPPGERKPGRVSAAFSRAVTWPARLSVAAKSAWLMAGFLVLAAVVVWAVFLTEPGHVAPRHAFTITRILAVIALMALIPLATYQVVRLWLEGDKSKFPDLDFAWDAGLEAVRRSGLSLDEVPLYVVLGSSGDRLERALAAAAGEDFRIRGVPEGRAALHWYVAPDRAFLFLTEASWVSGLAALAARRSRAGELPADALAALAGVAPGSASGTIAVGDLLAYAQSAARRAGEPGPALNSGTLAFDTLAARSAIAAAEHESRRPIPSSVALEQPALLPAQDSARALERLDYVARKLRLARRPFCPANGVLVLLPFDLVRGEANEKEELARATRADVTTLQNSLGLRAPVTALLTGLEQEPGFQELVRRVGRERAAAQRFGRRYDIRAVPTPSEMAATSAHVCGSFEDWIYSLFREQDALARPGTARLYALLCRVRCDLKDPLAEVLARGFGHDPALRADDQPILFSGCYVAATGDSEDRRAFVKGVFDKLDAEQEEIEWTPASRATDRRYRVVAAVTIAANVLLVASLVGMATIWALR